MNNSSSFKLSRYLVATPLEQVGGMQYILFSTRTARILLVSEEVYENLQKGNIDKVDGTILHKLIDTEILVHKSENELLGILASNNAHSLDSDILYQVIQPTAMCQLGCHYCGQKHSKDYITTDAMEKIINRIEGRLKTGQYKTLSIAWFGGEPLMGLTQIRLMTPKLMDLASRYGCDYYSRTTTNGLSLKENIYAELAQKLFINTIEITLDGTAEFHDKRRFTKEGLDSFDLIFKNLIKIFNRPDYSSLNCPITIRCNVDSTNFDGVKPLIKLLSEHGFQDKIGYFYTVPVHSWGNDAHLLSLEKEKFAAMEMEWLIEQYKYGFKPKLLPKRNYEVCLSVTPDSEVFDAFGNIFDCSETPLVDTYVDTPYMLGNINQEEQISTHRPLLNFYDDVENGVFPCTNCPMLPTCGGGCPKSWREGTLPCPSTKFNIQDKLLLFYFLKKNGAEALKNIAITQKPMQYEYTG